MKNSIFSVMEKIAAVAVVVARVLSTLLGLLNTKDHEAPPAEETPHEVEADDPYEAE